MKTGRFISTSSEIELIDNDFNQSESQTTTHPIVRKKLRLGSKEVCIGLSVISIIIVWIILLTPICVRLGTNRDQTPVTNTIFNLLPPINVTSNYSNFTIERVECVDNFVYVPGDEMCYPECDWNPSGDISKKIIRLFLDILSVFSIVLCTTTLIAWLLLSCIDWKKFRFHYDFQLPRTSLFMVVMSSLFLVVINASIDLTSRDFFFCQSTKEGKSYLLAHLFYSISNVYYRKVVTWVIGALFQYFLFVTLSWIVFSLININVVIFFPHLRESLRKRILFFLFQCLVCFGLNIIPVVIVIAANPESPYFAAYLIDVFNIFNIWGSIFFVDIPFFLIPGILISLIIVTVTKLRITSLQSRETTGRAFKLTDLEKRLIIYSIVLMLLLLLQGVNFILFRIIIIQNFFAFVTKFILCMTVNSPILTLPSNFTGSNATLNDTVPVYRENPYGDVDACRMLESEAFRLYPHYLVISFPIYLRLGWILVFFVLVPLCTPKSLIDWIRRMKDRLKSDILN